MNVETVICLSFSLFLSIFQSFFDPYFLSKTWCTLIDPLCVMNVIIALYLSSFPFSFQSSSLCLFLILSAKLYSSRFRLLGNESMGDSKASFKYVTLQPSYASKWHTNYLEGIWFVNFRYEFIISLPGIARLPEGHYDTKTALLTLSCGIFRITKEVEAKVIAAGKFFLSLFFFELQNDKKINK